MHQLDTNSNSVDRALLPGRGNMGVGQGSRLEQLQTHVTSNFVSAEKVQRILAHVELCLSTNLGHFALRL